MTTEYRLGRTVLRAFAPLAGIAILPVSLLGQAATTPSTSTDPVVTALQNQTALVNAQTALATAQASLVTAQASVATAKNAALTGALASLSTAGGNLPSGTYVANSTGVSTPIAGEMFLGMLDQKSGALADSIPTGTTAIVLTPTGQEITNQFLFTNFKKNAFGLNAAAKDFLSQAQKAVADANAKSSIFPPGSVHNYSLSPAIGLGMTTLADLPGVVKSVTGLFEVNTTESTFNPSVTQSEVQDILLGGIRKNSSSITIYLSVDAYIHAVYKAHPSTETYSAITDINNNVILLRDQVFQLDQYYQAYNNEAAILLQALKGIPSPGVPAAAPAAGAAPAATFAGIAPADLLDKYRKDIFLAAFLNDLSTSITAFIGTATSFVSNLTTAPASGGQPPLTAILYQELAGIGIAGQKPLQLELSLDNQLQSLVIQTGAFFTKRPVITSLYAVEYRLTDFAGVVEASGVIHGVEAKKMPSLCNLKEYGEKPD